MYCKILLINEDQTFLIFGLLHREIEIETAETLTFNIVQMQS